jgi:pyridoxamine 5'-phosphate oxidase
LTYLRIGSTLSRKRKEIIAHPKVALTFWWEETQRQIRIQGTASAIPQEDAHFFFNDQSYESKTVSPISIQDAITNDLELLRVRFRESVNNQQPIQKPAHWGGWKIKPYRIEFLEFKTSRLHHRTRYTHSQEGWE